MDEAFSKINQIRFDKYKNYFETFSMVQSKLVKGNPSVTPKPYISFVIPTFRRADFLHEAIDSILNQNTTYDNYEIIVVDNEPFSNTITETEKIMETYKCEKLLYYKNLKNIGMIGNWNRCIELARGEWIAFLHDDDLIIPEYIDLMLRILKRPKIRDAAYIKVSVTEFYENMGNLIKRGSLKNDIKKKLFKKLIQYKVKDIVFAGNAGVLGAPTCGTLIRKRAVFTCGGYNLNYYPSFDSYLPYLFLLRGFRVYQTILPMGYYRWSQNASLKKDTIYKWVEQYVQFRNTLKQQNLFSLCFYKIFQKEQDATFLEWIEKVSKDGKLPFTRYSFSEICCYEPNKTKKYILKIWKKSHKYQKAVWSILFG